MTLFCCVIVCLDWYRVQIVPKMSIKRCIVAFHSNSEFVVCIAVRQPSEYIHCKRSKDAYFKSRREQDEDEQLVFDMSNASS